MKRSNWRKGIGSAGQVETPRSFQARRNGPPLLFLTDVRMTILVLIATADCPVRHLELKRDLMERGHSAIEPLVQSGLIISWKPSRKSKVYALDPAHPAHEPLKRLLQKISKLYEFPTLITDSTDVKRGLPPVRRSRRRDARLTFGNSINTLVLLAVYLMVRPNMTAVTGALARFHKKSINSALWRYQAFGVLRQTGPGGRTGMLFELNPDYALADEIRPVLDSLLIALPQWTSAIRGYEALGRAKVRYKKRHGINQKDAALKAWSRS